MTAGIALGLAYLIGAFPSAFLIGKLMKKDILHLGSGNMGTANALRSLGKLPGAVVFLLDVGKGLLVLALGQVLGYSSVFLWWMAACAIIGHIYPIYLGFRGGKGLATGLAVSAWLQPWVIPIFCLLFLPLFLWRRHVATASTLGLWGVAVYLALIGIYPGTLITVVIIWRHWPETRQYIMEQLKREPFQS